MSVRIGFNRRPVARARPRPSQPRPKQRRASVRAGASKQVRGVESRAEQRRGICNGAGRYVQYLGTYLYAVRPLPGGLLLQLLLKRTLCQSGPVRELRGGSVIGVRPLWAPGACLPRPPSRVPLQPPAKQRPAFATDLEKRSDPRQTWHQDQGRISHPQLSTTQRARIPTLPAKKHQKQHASQCRQGPGPVTETDPYD